MERGVFICSILFKIVSLSEFLLLLSNSPAGY